MDLIHGYLAVCLSVFGTWEEIFCIACFLSRFWNIPSSTLYASCFDPDLWSLVDFDLLLPFFLCFWNVFFSSVDDSLPRIAWWEERARFLSLYVGVALEQSLLRIGCFTWELEWHGNVAQGEMDQQHQLPRVSSAALMRVSKTKLLVQQQPFQCSSSSEELELSSSSLRWWRAQRTESRSWGKGKERSSWWQKTMQQQR